MKIDDVNLYPVVVDRRYPTITAGPCGYWEVVKHSYFLILKTFTHDGIVGLGEVSDIGDEELLDPSKLDMLRKMLKKSLKGEGRFNIEKVTDDLQRTHELVVLLKNKTNFRLVLCAVDVFNVSTIGCGGIHQAKKVIALAEGADLEYLLGSTLELAVGTAGQAHLAASSKAVTLPSDLIGPLMYTDDERLEILAEG